MLLIGKGPLRSLQVIYNADDRLEKAGPAEGEVETPFKAKAKSEIAF